MFHFKVCIFHKGCVADAVSPTLKNAGLEIPVPSSLGHLQMKSGPKGGKNTHTVRRCVRGSYV